MRQLGAANIQSASFVELRAARKYCKTISHIKSFGGLPAYLPALTTF